MIADRSRSKEWILGIREKSPGRDPILIEKMILALTLVEALSRSGLKFIFKGGTSLILVLEAPLRFSIDIDIVLPEAQNLEDCFQFVVSQGVFDRWEEDKRPGRLPKAHYKFFFNSMIQQKESHILLDILFEENPYPRVRDFNLASSLVAVEGEMTRVFCPVAECLLGDKLTAFAPHTTGIRYGVDKGLEIAKQLLDVAALFDVIDDLSLVEAAFETVAVKELAYRAMHPWTPNDVLRDAFATACLIGMRGPSPDAEYAELVEGFKKLTSFIYSGYFSLDSAILCASKAAYLAALLLKRERTILRFEKGLDLSSWSIADLTYNRLNKLKKNNPQAFYYFYRAVNLLRPGENQG